MQPDDVPLIAKLSDGNVCLSGGAAGADLLWGEQAAKLGHQVIHWSFDGHKSYGAPEHTIRLDLDILKEADIRLEEANLSMKRYLPYHKTWLINLLRRNWFQIKHSKRIYGVGFLSDEGGISGGTAWAFTMADNIKIDEQYFFDQEKEKWFKRHGEWVQENLIFQIWKRNWIDIKIPPQPHGIWTGIGTRNLNNSGQNAINSLF